MTPHHPHNVTLAQRYEASTRGPSLIAIFLDDRDPDPENRFRVQWAKIEAAQGAVLAFVPAESRAVAIEVDAPAAAAVRNRLTAEGLAVPRIRTPTGGLIVVFGEGAPIAITRSDARFLKHVVLPGMRAPDGNAWVAEHGSPDVLAVLGDRGGNGLVTVPDWIRKWLCGDDMQPLAAPPSPPTAPLTGTCASCNYFDTPSSECRRETPVPTVDSNGDVKVGTGGWLTVQPSWRCPRFKPTTSTPRACGSCRWFARSHPGGHGRCAAAPLRPEADRTGRQTSMTAVRPEIAPDRWCGEFAALTGEGGR